MQTSSEINELALALVKAQAAIKIARKDSNNPFLKSTYADLGSVWDACRTALTDNGLSIAQCSDEAQNPDYIILETQLSHTSGQWMRGRMAMKPVKADPQSVGSCLTYMRRYSLAAMVGVVADDPDDDGNAASGNDAPKSNQDSAFEYWHRQINELVETNPTGAAAWWTQYKEDIKRECGDKNAADIYYAVKKAMGK